MTGSNFDQLPNSILINILDLCSSNTKIILYLCIFIILLIKMQFYCVRIVSHSIILLYYKRNMTFYSYIINICFWQL